MAETKESARGSAAWVLVGLLFSLLSAFPLSAHAAVFIVDTVADTLDLSPGDGLCATAAGTCSLRASIQEANASPGEDVIRVPAGTFTLQRAGLNESLAVSGDLDVTDALSIYGAGQATTVIDGNQHDRVIEVCPPGTCGPGTRVSFQDLTIRNGRRADLCTAYDHCGFGGGLLNFGTTLLASCTVTGNVLAPPGNVDNGGGIANFSSLTLYRSTVSANTAAAVGGIFSAGTATDLTLVESTIDSNVGRSPSGGGGSGALSVKTGTFHLLRSTVSRNLAGSDGGGGLRIETPATIENSTISGNTSEGRYGGLRISGLSHCSGNNLPCETSSDCSPSPPGQTCVHGTVVMVTNTTIADNTAAVECDGLCVGSDSPQISVMNSIIRHARPDQNCNAQPGSERFVSLGNNIENGDSCGLDDASDLPNTDPGLTALGNGGGPTQTHGLLLSSRALDEANPEACPPTDQRGSLRDDACGACDIGAFELADALRPVLRVTKTQDTNDGSCSAVDCSLREAIVASNASAGRETIELPAGTYEFMIPGAFENASASGDLDIRADVMIRGAGATQTVVDARQLDRLFDVVLPVRYAICGVTLQGGFSAAWGGAVNDAGDGRGLIARSVLANNRTLDAGGGTSNLNASTIRIVDSTIQGNRASWGGGIWSNGATHLLRSIVQDNIADGDNGGGGVASESGPVSLRDCLVDSNEATIGAGGGLRGGGISLRDTTVTANRAGTNGGGIEALSFDGDLSLDASTVTGNTAVQAGGGIHWGEPFGPNPRRTVANSTIADNVAAGVPNEIRSVQEDPSDLDVGESRGSIIGAGGVSGRRLVSRGHNLCRTSNCFFANQSTDLVNTDALLDPLADNGGPTPTRALGIASPAVDSGDPLGCRDTDLQLATTDQRGALRPHDGDLDTIARCDIGAFERHGPCVDADGDGYGAIPNPECPHGPAPDSDDANSHCGVDATDLDGDGWCGTLDCDDADGNAIRVPGEVRGLHFLADKTTLEWDAPFDAGGSAQTLVYDALRSNDPADFVSGTICVAAQSGPTTASDAALPLAGQVFFYLVRAGNYCPEGWGTLGVTSDGTERTGRSCN